MDNEGEQKIGRYNLVELLGKSDTAQVYKAYDTHLERVVALKVFLPSGLAPADFTARFRREAPALTHLSHASIVKVLDYGEDNGRPYLVMDYVSGGSLNDKIHIPPLRWADAAALLAPAARALEYLHRQKMAHGRVSPANILLDGSGQPLLSNVGSARLLAGRAIDADAADYRSPEQVAGGGDDFSADIYALGVVFYELVTGQKPSAARMQVSGGKRGGDDAFPRPRQVNRRLPQIVEDAILKAVMKDPARRYADMGQFAAVLEQLALGRKADTALVRGLLANGKPPKEAPLALIAGLLVLVVIFGGLFGWNWLIRQPGVEQALAFIPGLVPFTQTATPTSTLAPTLTPRPTSTNTPTAIPGEPTLTPVPTRTIMPTPTSIPTFPPVAIEGTPVKEGLLLTSGSPYEAVRWGLGGVNTAAWSPDGASIALGGTNGIFVLDSVTYKRKLFIDTGGWVHALWFTRSGTQIAAGLDDGSVSYYNASSGFNEVAFRYHPATAERIKNAVISTVSSAAVSADERYLAVGYANGDVNLWDKANTRFIAAFDFHSAPTALAFSLDGQTLYLARSDSSISIYNVAGGQITATFGTNSTVKAIEMSPDGMYGIAVDSSAIAYFFDPAQNRMLGAITSMGGGITGAAVSPDNALLAFGLANGKVKVYKKPAVKDLAAPQKEIYVLNAHPDAVTSVKFSPDGKLLLSTSVQEGLRIWDAATGRQVGSLGQSLPPINRLEFSPDSRWLAAGYDGGAVRLWSLASGQMVYSLPGYLPPGQPFSPTGRYLALAVDAAREGEPGALHVYEVATGKEAAVLGGYQRGWFVRFTDKDALLVAGSTQSAAAWDGATWERVQTQQSANHGCNDVSAVQNGRSQRLALIYDAGVLLTSDETTDKICALQLDVASPAAYFQAQHFMLYQIKNGALWLWNFDEKAPAQIAINPPRNAVDEFLAASPENGIYAYARANDRVWVSSVSSGLAFNIAYSQVVNKFKAALSPDGRMLALGSRFGSIHIFMTAK